MRGIFIGCAAALTIACGGRVDAGPQGLAGPTTTEPTVDYPTGDEGYNVGDVIPNLAFTGYEHMDPSTTIDVTTEPPGTVRFGDFYDPDGSKQISLLFVVIHAPWCWVSDRQEDVTNGSNASGSNTTGLSYAQQYASRGVRFMTLLSDGPVVGQPATVANLESWVAQHHARTTEALLSQAPLDVVGGAVPYNMIIDARTMRILEVWLGFDGTMKELDDVLRRMRMGF